MGYKFKSFLILSILYLLLMTLFFLIFYIGGWEGTIYLVSMLILPVVILLVQYLIGPLLIGWIYRVRWMSFDEVKASFPKIAELILDVTDTRGINVPRFGIIDDGNPNAFCYGYSKNKANLVITQGIIDLLNEDEQVAVVGHELGHISHGDFVIMLLASLVPTLAFYIYNTLRWVLRAKRGRSSRESGKADIILLIIMILAYITYIIGYMITLVLSRIREYWADEFSANATGNADNLARALVTIAYGLTSPKTPMGSSKSIEIEQEQEMAALKATFSSKAATMNMLGIADYKNSQNLVFNAAAYSQNKYEAIQYAAAWDLYNPWARYFELFSTHPLPAKRILALNKISEVQGIKPSIDLSQTKELARKQVGRTMIDEFLVDLMMWELPWFVFWAMLIFPAVWFIVLLINNTYLFGITNLKMFLVWSVFSIGVAKILKTEFKYKGGYKPMKIMECLKHIKASPIRSVPVIIQGELIGRGIPGLIISEDFVIKDDTGFMRIDYKSGLTFVNLWFALSKIRKYKGHKIIVKGWYRRAPGPYVQVKKIEVPDFNKTHRNYAKTWCYIGIFLLWIISLLLYIYL
ncbi:MAG: M48 family metalloprotease [Promethearchaeota archaeon]